MFSLIVSFATLVVLEIVLSMDNVLFIVLITSDIESKYQKTVRKLGIALAVFGRIVLLSTIQYLSTLSSKYIFIHNFKLTIKSAILIAGGLYLVVYAILQIITLIKGPKTKSNQKSTNIIKSLIIIFFLDSMLSFDSVFAAIALGQNLTLMIIAIVTAILILIFCIDAIGTFIHKHLTIRILTTCFLLLVGLQMITKELFFELNTYYLLLIVGFAGLVQGITVKVLTAHKNNH